jgi:hypothetical protein
MGCTAENLDLEGLLWLNYNHDIINAYYIGSYCSANSVPDC